MAISTGCLDLLSEEEILFVLAHELGHVHADHVLYKSAARVFGSVASTVVQATLGIGSLVVYPIQIALLRWDRASELSCDRAALLVVKNPSVALKALMKLSGGSREFNDQLEIGGFIEQADHFGTMQDEGPLGRYITVLQTLFRTHPFPIWRAKELMEWITAGNFLEVLDGDYDQEKPPTEACVQCKETLRPGAFICPHCGAPQDESSESMPPSEERTSESESPSSTDDPIGQAWKGAQDWYRRNFELGEDPPEKK